ncbi:glutamate--tRNA ligase [Puniceicoccus vermicola]|uniref:Glutamate--tRNA ligase n=1 Tax=Puniceicoccus vermicola TaxID=388746 RepID=A0A7X1AWW0_9BACT|nr:glutamate--tRNA ligase family protein [Puniceicoccus vermicola]MBC2601322.1 glutamate--tRNA ligase [Puniceicoccus vermicola]
MPDVRVRFAPSPTGFFHIGSARTALFNWLYARHCNGIFVLRIEDTDHERNTPEALRVLLEGMRWLGLDWDEGPEVGGDKGPYFQSQRSEIYKAAVQKLLDNGRAYEKDGAVFFRLEGERYREHDQYLGEEVEKVRAEPMIFEDAIRGRIERVVDRDFPIVRANGDPVFHLVNVVDDIEMGITHVIRGEDHLANTARHLELFYALGAKPPVFAHLPLILKDPAVGKGKMSKRDQGALIEEYQNRHFLAEAVRNFLCLLGWNPKDDREIMPIGEIIENFDFPGIQKGAARFDEAKLRHMNGHYLRELPVESYAWLARPILAGAGIIEEDADEDFLQKVLELCRPKLDLLENLGDYCGFFFTRDYPMDEKARAKVGKKADPSVLATELLAEVRAEGSKGSAGFELAIERAAEKNDRKSGAYRPLTRFAVTGSLSGPDLGAIIDLLGLEEVAARLEKLAAEKEEENS